MKASEQNQGWSFDNSVTANGLTPAHHKTGFVFNPLKMALMKDGATVQTFKGKPDDVWEAVNRAIKN